MNVIRAVILDDEDKARQALSCLLQQYTPSVNVVGSFSSISDTVDFIAANEFDLIFLDVEIPPHGTGFTLLEEISRFQKRFAVIFVTGFTHYAIKAFRANAVDYLVKPIDIDELKEAVGRVESFLLTNQIHYLHEQVATLLDYQSHGKHDPTILIKTHNGYRKLQIADIAWCVGLYQSTTFHMGNGEEFISLEPIGSYEPTLQENRFVYTQRSTYVNSAHILQYIDDTKKPGGGKVILQNGARVEVSRRQKTSVISYLKGRKQA